MLLHGAVFFGALSALTTAAAFWPGLIRARFWFGLPVGLVLVALVTWNASILSGSRDLDIYLGITAVVSALTVLPGRATLQEGGVHLVLFAAFVFLAINP